MALASAPHRRGIALPSEDTLAVVKGSLSRYCHPKAGHVGEGEEEEVAHGPRTAGGHDEPETPKQRPVALHPTKTPARRSHVSRKSTLPSVNHSDGLMETDYVEWSPSLVSLLTEPAEFVMTTTLPGFPPSTNVGWARVAADSRARAALPTGDTSMPSEVSGPNRTVPIRNVTSRSRKRRTLHQKYLRALICSTIPLSLNCTTNNQNIYVSSRTSLVHQGPATATDTHLQTRIAHAVRETEIIGRASSTLTMKAVTADAQ